MATSYKLFHLSKKVGLTRQKLYFRRKNPTSITQQKFNLERLDDITLSEERRDFFRDIGDLELYWQFYIKATRKVSIYRMAVKKYYPEEIQIEHELQEKLKTNLKTILKCPQVSLKDKGMILVYSTLYEFPAIIRILSLVAGKVHTLD